MGSVAVPISVNLICVRVNATPQLGESSISSLPEGQTSQFIGAGLSIRQLICLLVRTVTKIVHLDSIRNWQSLFLDIVGTSSYHSPDQRVTVSTTSLEEFCSLYLCNMSCFNRMFQHQSTRNVQLHFLNNFYKPSLNFRTKVLEYFFYFINK